MAGGGTNPMKNRRNILLCAMLLSALLCLDAAAAELSAWGNIQEQTAILYLPAADPDGELTCQVGTTLVDVSAKQPITQLDAPIETVIVLDNSYSIAKEERTVIGEILEDLIANRLIGETYTIATISDEVTYLCQGESDYTRLKSVIKELQYHDQYTQLTDGLYQILDELHRANDGRLRRIVLVADGVDNKQIGYTREELDTLIQELNYPIYAIGCTNSSADGNEQLESLFALSRLTSGASYHLSESVQTMDVVSGIMTWNDALRVEVPLPPEICDGSDKMIRVTSGTGTADNVYTTQLTMPFAVVLPQEPETQETPPPTTPTPAPEEPEKAPSALIPALIALAVVVVLISLVAVLVILHRRKKKAERFVHLPADELAQTIMQSKETEILDETELDGGTAMVWDAAPTRTLILRDVSMPDRRYEAPLYNVVAVGRDSTICQIVLAFDQTVARHQCDIYTNDGQVVVRNRSTSNITMVNGQKVVDEHELASGSLLKMGRVVMRAEII